MYFMKMIVLTFNFENFEEGYHYTAVASLELD